MERMLFEPIIGYCHEVENRYRQRNIFPDNKSIKLDVGDVRVIELFAGVGGFRFGLENASKRFKTVWNNQWEPSTKRQDASICYCNVYGHEGHSNEDINFVPVEEIPHGDLLCGGFPCQDYSVATTLKNSKGLEGKKGVLWWQIHRILRDSENPPKYLFLENVDRLVKSPASQRGRDFAIILASLSDLGYDVEWRIINAADYGMPQRRRRTYIVAYKNDTSISLSASISPILSWILNDGVISKAFPCRSSAKKLPLRSFKIEGTLVDITKSFNKGTIVGTFGSAGFMSHRNVTTLDVDASYDGPYMTLQDVLVDEKDVPEDFFISEIELKQWKYLKGSKSEKRKSSEGYEYNYSEGSMAFPDFLDRPSRTIITGEGGKGASRFKHVIKTESGRYRRLVPVELERLNMFPDGRTKWSSDTRRAFLMGNALVTGIVEQIGRSLIDRI